MRIAVDGVQLVLPGTGVEPVDRWAGLPEASRARVLRLLGELIARGILVADEGEGPEECGE